MILVTNDENSTRREEGAPLRSSPFAAGSLCPPLWDSWAQESLIGGPLRNWFGGFEKFIF